LVEPIGDDDLEAAGELEPVEAVSLFVESVFDAVDVSDDDFSALAAFLYESLR
jgi:hypothetical protein